MKRSDTIDRLLAEHGTTFAEEAGITLRDTPSPLYRTQLLALLFATRIRADIAVAAARELSRAGWRTARAMAGSDWQERVDALGRAHYRRYDESTATALGEGAELLLERWGGDLRNLRAEADRDPERIRVLLQEIPRMGPTAADIFCREVQGLWPELRPTLDQRARQTASDLGLPTRPNWRSWSPGRTCRSWPQRCSASRTPAGRTRSSTPRRPRRGKGVRGTVCSATRWGSAWLVAQFLAPLGPG